MKKWKNRKAVKPTSSHLIGHNLSYRGPNDAVPVGENEIEKTPVIKRKQPERVAKTPAQPDKETEQAKDNAAERRKRALEMIREKRSKKRNDGAQTANTAPDQFDSPKAQNEFSQTVPTVNLDSEQILQTQGSSTPSVNAASNTRKTTPESTVKYFRKKKIFPRKTFKTPPVATPDSELQIVEFQQETPSQPLEVPPLALFLPSSVQEELIKDDFIYVSPQKETQQTSNNDSVIEDLFKDDYVYEVSNEDPAKEQQQQSKEPTDVTVSLTSSIIEEFFKDDDVYEISDDEEQQQSQESLVAWKSEQQTLILSSFDSAAEPRERENERPSFNLGISPPASQPRQPSQLSVSQLEILKEAVVDAGVTAALNFAEATTSELTLPASEVYKTPEKKKKSQMS
ncbi:uncharacterized protein DS421_11g330670 [Arachis hypogaea]|nr:uncharacterized protein DS421_11g330670 [Arachis hypogaea]